ncbi:hypothetical protein AB0H51_22370 [Streptomyces griseoluteus]|uniref:hypothetical protein n=1 Tax=Streptomyces griseoluteus TaxID=29306 RepID=UPI0033FA089A
MTDRALRTTLTEETAAASRGRAGVAVLRPGLDGRLRSALPRGASAANGGRAVPSGVRLSRPDEAGPWQVEIHVGHAATCARSTWPAMSHGPWKHAWPGCCPAGSHRWSP